MNGKEGLVVARHRGKRGRAYEVEYKQDNKAEVTFSYLCPYCDKEANVKNEYSTGLDIIEKGMFYELLACNHCSEIAEVRFLPHNRI